MARVETPRERTERIERDTLSSFAVRSAESKGRERTEAPDPLRTCFQRDRDRIVHAKAFRRLKHKTQVFLAPEGDHYRVRLTHTLEVRQIARTAARALAAQRGPDRGYRAGPRPRAHAVRPPGRGGADAVPRPSRSGTTSSPCAWSTTSRTTARGSTSPGRSATASCTTRGRCRRPRRSRPRSSGSPTGSPTSTTTSTTRIRGRRAPARASCPAAPPRSSARRTPSAIDTLVTDLVATRHGRAPRSGCPPPVFRALDVAARLPVRAGLPARRGKRRARPGDRAAAGHCSRTTSTIPTSSRPSTIGCPGDLPTRVADYIAGMTDRYAVRTYEQLFLPQGWLL